jgi:hypothetical protein
MHIQTLRFKIKKTRLEMFVMVKHTSLLHTSVHGVAINFLLCQAQFQF